MQIRRDGERIVRLPLPRGTARQEQQEYEREGQDFSDHEDFLFSFSDLNITEGARFCNPESREEKGNETDSFSSYPPETKNKPQGPPEKEAGTAAGTVRRYRT